MQLEAKIKMNSNVEAEKTGMYFAQLLLQNDVNDKSKIIELYHKHFLNSRVHIKHWYTAFNESALKTLEENKVTSNLLKIVKEALTFEIKIQEHHFFKIRDVIVNKRNNKEVFFANDYFINSYKFLHDYKNFFMTKHLYSILNNCSKIMDINVDNFNFKDFFLRINSKSLTGQLFVVGDSDINISFKIPLNISTCFMFWNNNKLIGIDTSIDVNFDKEFLLNHFINLHILYKKNPKEIQEVLKQLQPKKNKSIIGKLSTDKAIDYSIIKTVMNDNVEYILDMNIYTEYDRLNNYELITSHLLMIESESNNGFDVPDQLNKIIFYDIVNQLGYDDIIDKEFREKCLFRILSSFKDHQTMLYNLTILPENRNFLKDIVVKFFTKIKEDISSKTNNENIVKNHLFSYGINSKENRDIVFEIISNKNIINIKDFFTIFKDDAKWISDIIILLNSNHVDNIIKGSIMKGIKDKNIIELLLKYDFKNDVKKSTRRIEHYREQKELKKVLDMNLNVKK